MDSVAFNVSSWPLPSRPRVLLVQAQASARLELSRMLRGAGAEVITARDDREGWHYLQNDQFDVLVTELGMSQGYSIGLMQQCLSLPTGRRPKHVIPLGLGMELTAFGFALEPSCADSHNLPLLLERFRGPLN